MASCLFFGWAEPASAQVAGAEVQIATRSTDQPPGTVPARVDNLAPFPPLSEAAQKQLGELLKAWEVQSQSTKTLECRFQRWHYDMFAAPAGIHASKAEGVIKYASPDMGLFKVETLVSFDGMVNGKPVFTPKPTQLGEHWVCNGEELIEFDHVAKECKIQQLPEEMRGQKIIESPLPFVFNLDAKQLQERYWVRQVQAPKPGIILIEAYPKLQEARAQYKLVQIPLDEETMLPQALIMYDPNFDVKTAPKWDHYEFSDIKRNKLTQGFNMFLKNFIEERPPATYKVFRNAFRAAEPLQMAEQPGENPTR